MTFKDITPDTILRAHHDGEGWCIIAERAGLKPMLFGGYAATAKDAQWAAGECARAWGCKSAPLCLN